MEGPILSVGVRTRGRASLGAELFTVLIDRPPGFRGAEVGRMHPTVGRKRVPTAGEPRSSRPDMPKILRVVVLAVVAAGGSLVPSSSFAHDVDPLARLLVLTARLDGDQVVRPEAFRPPDTGSGSDATGFARIQVDSQTGSFDFDLWVSGISPGALDQTHGPNETAFHLHLGGPDERGPILIDLHDYARRSGGADGGVTPTEDGFEVHFHGDFFQLQGELDTGFGLEHVRDAFRSERVFIAIHTTTNALFRTGEIRGNFQFVPETIDLRIPLDGDQVVRPPAFQPPLKGSGSTATGEALLRLYTRTGHLVGDLEVQGIDASALDATHGPNRTAIHLHEGGPDDLGPPLVDIHMLSRTEENPSGIEATSQGFRMRVSGRVAEPDTPVFDRIVEAFRTERAYANTHTTTNDLFRAGEIRGQGRVEPSELVFRATLDGDQVVRPPAFQPPRFGSGSDATGELELRIDRPTGRFRATLECRGIDPVNLDTTHGANGSAIHVHWGTAETRGPIIIDLQHFARATRPDSDGVEATDEGFLLEADGHITQIQGEQDTQFVYPQILDFLRTEDVYITVHTATNDLFRGGEIRGNLGLESGGHEVDRFRVAASLDGSQVVLPDILRPPEMGSGSAATGEARLDVDVTTLEFAFELTVDDIDPARLHETHGDNDTAIHIHKGTPRANGPIVLDVHHFARVAPPGAGGIEAQGDGFVLRASGRLGPVQGALDVGFSALEIVDILLSDEGTYVAVHTSDNAVFRAGEIRGTFRSSDDVVPSFVRGDCNGDGEVEGQVADAVALLLFSFRGGAEPTCLAACDANADGEVGGQVTDAVYLLSHNFLGGPAPLAPFPDCGPPEFNTDRALGCRDVPSCP